MRQRARDSEGFITHSDKNLIRKRNDGLRYCESGRMREIAIALDHKMQFSVFQRLRNAILVTRFSTRSINRRSARWQSRATAAILAAARTANNRAHLDHAQSPRPRLPEILRERSFGGPGGALRRHLLRLPPLCRTACDGKQNHHRMARRMEHRGGDGMARRPRSMPPAITLRASGTGGQDQAGATA